MSELFDATLKEKRLLAKLEQALVIQRKKVQDLAKQILDAHGKGPHDIGDGRPGGYVVASRGEIHFLTPAVKEGAGAKKKEGEAAPSTPPPAA